MKQIKVRAKETFRNLEGIFKKGDILTLETILHEEDHLIHHALYGGVFPQWGGFILWPARNKIPHDEIPKGWYKVCDPCIAPKGSYKSSVIITGDGRRYDSSVISGAIGRKPFSELFERI